MLVISVVVIVIPVAIASGIISDEVIIVLVDTVKVIMLRLSLCWFPLLRLSLFWL